MKTQRLPLVFIIPIALVVVSLGYLLVRAFTPDRPTVTGMVECASIDVASKIPGRVSRLMAHDGDRVAAGQTLALLESKEMDAKLEQARSAMEAARARMSMVLHGARPEEKEAVARQFQQASAQFALAEKTWKRIERVYRDSLISTQERDQVEFQYTAALQQMEMARARYDMVMNGARREEIDGATALFHQAENAYREALAYHSELQLVSPTAGELTKTIIDEGEIVAGGYPVMTLTRPDSAWVIVQLKEDDMKSVSLGKHFIGTVRSLEQEKQEFVVDYISPMADFATWKPTNQKGDFDVRTFEIHLRPIARVPGLRPGMTVNIEL
jgi:HlyD family secretion protein